MCPREGHAKGTDMTTVQQHLVAKTKESDRTHVIVMTAVVAVISATAALVAGSASSTLLSAPRHEAVTVDARASEAPVMPQSLGYLEFDWSTASRGVPGFAPLSSNSAAH